VKAAEIAMTSDLPAPERRRVLFVADSTYWITATIARQICQHNPWITPTLCSWSVLAQILQMHDGAYPGDVDIVHFLTWQIAAGFMHVFRPTTPCVVAIHHIEDDRSAGPVADADAVMTVCHQWHRELLALGTPPEKCVMVPNGIDTDLFKPASPTERRRARKHLGIPQDSICIGFSGKRSSNSLGRKGIATLLAAMQMLNPGIKFSLAVIGPGWNDLMQGESEANFTLAYKPFLLDRSDVANFYNALDLYWVTSTIEGGPVPLLEAMSSGLTCISSPVGVALEAIDPGVNGFIAPFNSPAVYASITNDLARNPDERTRLGEAARATIIRQFQSWQTTQNVASLYAAAELRFRQRGGSRSSDRQADPWAASGAGRMLSSLPPELHARLTSAEHLAFMRHLLECGATSSALRVGWRAIASNPSRPGVWKAVLRALPKLHWQSATGPETARPVTQGDTFGGR
jgi:glycosyltransferase involved in cell wall biosynthesis